MKRPILFFLLCAITVVGGADETKRARSIDDVLHNAKRHEIVLVAGTVKRSFDLYNVLLTDGSGDIAVSLVGVRQDIRPGDAIAVVGRFDGRVGYRADYGLLNATDWAPQSDPKFAELRDKYGVAVATAIAVPTSAAPSVSPADSEISTVSARSASTVELRLRELDDLKTKNLVTPDEYQEQRKRILNQL